MDTGGADFQDHELVELLLFYAIPRKNTNNIAHELCERFGTIDKMAEASIDELKLVIRHSPGECEDGYRQIFGHLHRGERPLVLAAKDYFCVCVMFHDGFPVSLESAIAQMSTAEDCS